MNAYLLTWNPKHRGADGMKWIKKTVEKLKRQQAVRDQWSTGSTTTIPVGARVFLLRQGRNQPGIVASGYVSRGWFQASHWQEERSERGDRANYIKVQWDAMVLPEHALSRKALLKGILPDSLVDAQASGCKIPLQRLTRLEDAWAHHFNSSSVGAARFLYTSVAERYDSVDDLDATNFGSDGAPRTQRVVSGVVRDPRVRRAVAKRSKGRCERDGCMSSHCFPGFIDVHHILGAEKSDRVWNCVALCPNCHREAHYAVDRTKLNRALLRFARRFK